MDPPWTIQLLGGISARRGDQTVSHFETRKTALLLACLALDLRRAHSREELAERLWPDEEWDATRNRLRQAVAALRKALAPVDVPSENVLIADRTTPRLDPASVSTDVMEFEMCVSEAVRHTDP